MDWRADVSKLFEDASERPKSRPRELRWQSPRTNEIYLPTEHQSTDGLHKSNTLTAQEDRGREIYVTAQCGFCHGGPLLSDQNFHNIGVRPQVEDIGRALVTGSVNDRARFKTPTLRNVELRVPYA
jgi:cytochrome c peroxidase